jgi:hypothetical protein
MSKSEHWIVCVEYGGYKGCVRAYEGYDIKKAYIRIGQMALSEGIDQIIVYKNCKEYRCYELKPDSIAAKRQALSEGKKEEPLTVKQKQYIKLFLGDGQGKCSDGYLMRMLGVFEWKEAERMIEQYKREEGKNDE